MRIIGFNFTKVSAERAPEFALSKDISTNIEFNNIEKENTPVVQGDSEALKASFKFTVNYTGDKKDSKNGEIALSGFIIIMATKEESKEVLNSWKKKEIPSTLKVPIFNFILKKCSVRAMQLEEELNLPLHISIPQVRHNSPENKK